jgi:hypothetical protein
MVKTSKAIENIENWKTKFAGTSDMYLLFSLKRLGLKTCTYVIRYA